MLITKAFTQIEKLASKYRNSTVSCAIKYLHNKVTLSAEQICTILKIFNISIPCDRILRNSITLKQIEINHIENSYKKSIKKSNSDHVYPGTTIEKNTQNQTYSELPNEIYVNEPASDRNFLPIMIEDIKFCGISTIYENTTC